MLFSIAPGETNVSRVLDLNGNGLNTKMVYSKSDGLYSIDSDNRFIRYRGGNFVPISEPLGDEVATVSGTDTRIISVEPGSAWVLKRNPAGSQPNFLFKTTNREHFGYVFDGQDITSTLDFKRYRNERCRRTTRRGATID